MRIDNLLMMIAIGLVLGEHVNRALGNGAYRRIGIGRSGRKRMRNISEDEGAASDKGKSDNFLEKLVTEYEIIPLMSKLI